MYNGKLKIGREGYGKLGVHVGMDCTDMNMIGMGYMYYVRLVWQHM